MQRGAEQGAGLSLGKPDSASPGGNSRAAIMGSSDFAHYFIEALLLNKGGVKDRNIAVRRE